NVRDRAGEAVASSEVLAAAVAAQSVDLLRRDDTPVALVARDLDPAGAVPPAQRVETDSERRRRLARCVLLLRHLSSRTCRGRRTWCPLRLAPGVTFRAAVSPAAPRSRFDASPRWR